MIPINRELPDGDWVEFLAVIERFAQTELAPYADQCEADAVFPRDSFRKLGELGCLGLPYPQSVSGAGAPFQAYVQIIEVLSQAWLTVGLGVSVHTLSAHGVANFGSEDLRARTLPEMLAGEQLGAYCLSEPQSGSDAAGLATTARRVGSDYVINGTKAWITHGGVADYYTVMARTGPERTAGISCFLVPATAQGLSFGNPERKMGMTASPTAQVNLDDVYVPETALVGELGQGFTIALAALDAGRLGIAACAVGLAQAALDEATLYAQTRQQFGQPIGDFQGLRFLLADMATQVSAARSLLLSAARRKDDGLEYGAHAAMAKLFATDTCMKVTTNAVQVLGGSGYVSDFPVERYMREAKVLQIVEGTNQIQREVVGRAIMR